MSLPSYIKMIWTLKVIRWVRLCLTALTSHPHSQSSIGLVFNGRLGIYCNIIIFPGVSVQNNNNILFCMVIQHRAWMIFCISNYMFRSCLPVTWLDYNQYCYLYLIPQSDCGTDTTVLTVKKITASWLSTDSSTVHQLWYNVNIYMCYGTVCHHSCTTTHLWPSQHWSKGVLVLHILSEWDNNAFFPFFSPIFPLPQSSAVSTRQKYLAYFQH